METFIKFEPKNRQGRNVIVGVNDKGCHSVVSHKLNADGYFRKVFKTATGKSWVMFHRFVWEQEKGPIPEGYTIDHLCNNRACCNIHHLQVLTRTDHAVKTNINRGKNNGFKCK